MLLGNDPVRILRDGTQDAGGDGGGAPPPKKRNPSFWELFAAGSGGGWASGASVQDRFAAERREEEQGLEDADRGDGDDGKGGSTKDVTPTTSLTGDTLSTGTDPGTTTSSTGESRALANESSDKELGTLPSRGGGGAGRAASLLQSGVTFETNTGAARNAIAEDLRKAGEKLGMQGALAAMKGQEQYNELVQQTDYLGKLADEYKDASKRAFDDSMSEVRKLQQLGEEITNMAPQPGRLFLDSHGAATFASALSIAAGAMNSARFGGRNTALAIIDGASQRDMEAQQTAQVNARAGAAFQRGVFHDMLEVYKSDRVARHAYLNMQYMLAAKELKKISVQWDSLIMKSKAEQLQAELNAKANHNLMMAGRVMVNMKVAHLAGNAEQRMREALGGLPIRNIDDIMRAYSPNNATSRLTATMDGIQKLRENNLIDAEQQKRLVEIAKSEMGTAAAMERQAARLSPEAGDRGVAGSSVVGERRVAPGRSLVGRGSVPGGTAGGTSGDQGQGSGEPVPKKGLKKDRKPSRARVGSGTLPSKQRRNLPTTTAITRKLREAEAAVAKAAPGTDLTEENAQIARLKAMQTEAIERDALRSKAGQSGYLNKSRIQALNEILRGRGSEASRFRKFKEAFVTDARRALGPAAKGKSYEDLWDMFVSRAFPAKIKGHRMDTGSQQGDSIGQQFRVGGALEGAPENAREANNALRAMFQVSGLAGEGGIPESMTQKIELGDPVLAVARKRGVASVPAVILRTSRPHTRSEGLVAGSMKLVVPIKASEGKDPETLKRIRQVITVPTWENPSAMGSVPAAERRRVQGANDASAILVSPDTMKKARAGNAPRFFFDRQSKKDYQEYRNQALGVRQDLTLLGALAALSTRKGGFVRFGQKSKNLGSVSVDLNELRKLGEKKIGGISAAAIRKRLLKWAQDKKSAVLQDFDARPDQVRTGKTVTISTSGLIKNMIGQITQITGRGVPQAFEQKSVEDALPDPSKAAQFFREYQDAYDTMVVFIQKPLGKEGLEAYTYAPQGVLE